MSPAACNAHVGWVAKINELGVDRRYRIKFRRNPSIGWQDRFLNTLACFARDIVIVESTEGGDGAA
jgi:hypothetical protein